jgi:hypothetical protein
MSSKSSSQSALKTMNVRLPRFPTVDLFHNLVTLFMGKQCRKPLCVIGYATSRGLLMVDYFFDLTFLQLTLSRFRPKYRLINSTPSSQPGSETKTHQLLQLAPESFSQGPIRLNFVLVLEELWWANGLLSPRRIGPVKIKDLEGFSVLRIQLDFVPRLEELWWMNGLPLLKRIGSVEMGHLGDVGGLLVRRLPVSSHIRLRSLLRPEQGVSELEQKQLDDPWQEQKQLEFKPSLLDLEFISVSDGPLTLVGLSREILRIIADFLDIKMFRNLMITCKTFRNYFDTLFLKALISKENQNRAISKFIADAIGDNNDTCLWRDATFSLVGRKTPKCLSIHLFTDTTTEKIQSDKVHTMIIQISEPFGPYEDIGGFLKLLFSEGSFTSLKCLMFYGSQFLTQLTESMVGNLKLKAFHMAKFCFSIPFLPCYSDRSDTLEALYVVYSGDDRAVAPRKKLKKLVIYCTESNEDAISSTKTRSNELRINTQSCCALEEM